MTTEFGSWPSPATELYANRGKAVVRKQGGPQSFRRSAAVAICAQRNEVFGEFQVQTATPKNIIASQHDRHRFESLSGASRSDSCSQFRFAAKRAFNIFRSSLGDCKSD